MSEGIRVTAFSLATKYVGTREGLGAAANSEILGWLHRAGSSATDDSESWCSAFVYHPAFLLDLPAPAGWDRLRARRWLAVGTPVNVLDAKRGFDVAIFKRGGPDQPGPEVLDAQGHVAWFADADAEGVHVLGGNQGARGEVSFAYFPMDQLLGIRRLWPR